MNDIRRYNPEVDSYDEPFMHPHPNGDYVKYVEYLAEYNSAIKLRNFETTEIKDLRAQVKTLKLRLRNTQDKLDKINGS